MKKALILTIFLPLIASAQLMTARTGIDTGTGGEGRSIIRLESNSFRALTTRELNLGVDSVLTNNSSSSVLNKFAVDLANIEEVTLKDGTVIKIDELQERLQSLKN